MTDLDNVRMCPSNIAHVVNAMNTGQSCEQVSEKHLEGGE